MNAGGRGELQAWSVVGRVRFADERVDNVQSVPVALCAGPQPRVHAAGQRLHAPLRRRDAATGAPRRHLLRAGQAQGAALLRRHPQTLKHAVPARHQKRQRLATRQSSRGQCTIIFKSLCKVTNYLQTAK